MVKAWNWHRGASTPASKPSTDIRVPIFITTLPNVAYKISLLTGLRNRDDQRKVKTTKAQPAREMADATRSVVKSIDSCSRSKPVTVIVLGIDAVQINTGQRHSE